MAMASKPWLCNGVGIICMHAYIQISLLVVDKLPPSFRNSRDRGRSGSSLSLVANALLIDFQGALEFSMLLLKFVFAESGCKTTLPRAGEGNLPCT